MLMNFREFLEEADRKTAIKRITDIRKVLFMHIAFIKYYSFDPSAEHHLEEANSWLFDICDDATKAKLKRDSLERILFYGQESGNLQKYNINSVIHDINAKITKSSFIKDKKCTPKIIEDFIDYVLNSFLNDMFIKHMNKFNIYDYLSDVDKQKFD